MTVRHRRSRSEDDTSLVPRQRRIASWIAGAHASREPLNITAVRRRRPDLLAEAFSMRPFWGWRRAIEAAGLSYDEIAWELEDKLRCEICGLERASLIKHLVKQHELGPGEYQAEFPDAFVCSETVRAAQRRSTRLIMPHWEPLWSPEYVLDRISHYFAVGIPLNAIAMDRREPSLVGMATIYFGDWCAALHGAGVEDAEVRLVARKQFLDEDDVVERIRSRREEDLPLNSTAVIAGDRALYTAAVKRFGSWRKALLQVGIAPESVLKSRRFDGERELLRRVRQAAALSGAAHRRELRRLHEDVGSVVQHRYGGWKSLAAHLGVPAGKLVRRVPPSIAETRERLEHRRREGAALTVGAIRKEDSKLYYAVIRHFGTFEECYEELGLPAQPTPRFYLRAEQDPEHLLDHIRRAIGGKKPRRSLLPWHQVGSARLALMSRKHFGSWEEGLRRAGLMEQPGIEVYLYAHPRSILRDLGRVASGELLADRRLAALARHTRKLYGSVIGGLTAAGMSRSAALDVEMLAEYEPYTSGRSVRREIVRRSREGLPLTHGALRLEKHMNTALLRAGKMIFGSWTAALDEAAEQRREEGRGPSSGFGGSSEPRMSVARP